MRKGSIEPKRPDYSKHSKGLHKLEGFTNIEKLEKRSEGKPGE